MNSTNARRSGPRRGLQPCPPYVATALLVLAVGTRAALASTPADVADLEGASAYGAERDLQSRGYHRISMSPGDERVWSYWWNPSRRECVSLVTSDGQVTGVSSAASSDCNQSSSSSGASVSSSGADSSQAAAVALGAAALIGAVALAHNSHQHKDGKHYDDNGKEADYERGYRDGMYSTGYHNYSHSNAYSDGYEAGARQRGYETSYRNGYYEGAGYSRYSSYGNLQYEDKDQAHRDLQRKGYERVDSYRNDNGNKVELYWNDVTQQCLSLAIRNGRVDSVHSVPKRNCR